MSRSTGVKIQRKPGKHYFIDGPGRVIEKDPGKGGARRATGVTVPDRKPGGMYYVDKTGDVREAERGSGRRAGPPAVKSKSPWTSVDRFRQQASQVMHRFDDGYGAYEMWALVDAAGKIHKVMVGRGKSSSPGKAVAAVQKLPGVTAAWVG
jgi:hypothetical protein